MKSFLALLLSCVSVFGAGTNSTDQIWVSTGGFIADGATISASGPATHTAQIFNQTAGTNNFIVFGDGSVVSTAVTNSGAIRTATFLTTGGGTSTTVSNITLGASPFAWTNNLGCNVFIVVDGGTAFSATWLDTTVQSSLASGVTLPLQPNEWTKITYTVAPGMFVKKW